MMNPFKFGKEVSGDQFYDRTEVGEKLYTRLSGGASNVVMYAPRRYGKTSLVKRVLKRFQDEGTPTLHFDLNRVESLERFCEEYTSALCSLVGPVTQLMNRVSTLLSHLHPVFTLDAPFSVSVKLDFGAKMTSSSVSAVLNLAEQLAIEQFHKPIVIAFDEFQEIERLSPGLPLEGVFRSCIQAHQNVRYVFFGSKTHLMRRMFGEKSRPFYNSASTIRLEKPPEDESLAFIVRRFKAGGLKIAAETAQRILVDSANIPYYLQQLSAFTYDAATLARHSRVSLEDVEHGVEELMNDNADYYFERISSLSAAQRVLLRALAAEPVRVFDEDYRTRHGLGSSSSVHSALKVLEEQGFVETEDKRLFVGDPFLARTLLMPAAIS